MSVVKGKRGENKLEVLGYAAKAAVETIRYVKKEKLFPRRERWILAVPIALLAIAAYVCARMANARYIEDATDPTKAELRKADVEYRLHLEKIAHGCYQAQLGLMDIAYDLREGVDSHTVEVWTGYVLDADTALLKWIKSEKSRAKPGE